MRSITSALSMALLKVARGRDIISFRKERPSPARRQLSPHNERSSTAPSTCLGLRILITMKAKPAPPQVGSFSRVSRAVPSRDVRSALSQTDVPTRMSIVIFVVSLKSGRRQPASLQGADPTRSQAAAQPRKAASVVLQTRDLLALHLDAGHQPLLAPHKHDEGLLQG
jgi:hypothetical protein